MANHFSKVSFTQYYSDVTDQPLDSGPYADAIRREYDNITLPVRATPGSAGYDFFAPVNFCLNPQVPVKVFTGIHAEIQPGHFLMIVPRSSLGFKYGVRLVNTVGIIDSDYINAENEGHIIIKLTSTLPIAIHAGERFAQGIFLPYGLTADDAPGEARVGGVGSTGK